MSTPTTFPYLWFQDDHQLLHPRITQHTLQLLQQATRVTTLL